MRLSVADESRNRRRHPEEPRPCAASRRIAACARFHPSRLAEDGEHLRMTTSPHPTASAQSATGGQTALVIARSACDEAIQSFNPTAGLLRFARNDELFRRLRI